MKHGKHYIDAAKQVDSTKLYDVNEALELACKLATAKFDETVELHVRLGVDGRHADQQVRGAVVLPNGTGKTVRVCAIAKGPAASAAEAAGADIVGDDDLIAKIQGGFMDFDVVVTTPDMMGKVGRLGKLLGPRGLMPNPKAGTVTPDLGKAVKEAKAGKIEYRLDKQNIIHVPVGKASFGAEKLFTNLDTVMEAIAKAKPAAAKGTYFKSATIATTMGPGIRLNTLPPGDKIFQRTMHSARWASHTLAGKFPCMCPGRRRMSAGRYGFERAGEPFLKKFQNNA